MCSIKTELGFLILYIHNEFYLCFSIQTKLQLQKSLTESSGWNRCKKIVIFLMRNSKKKMIKALDQLFTANYTLGYHDHYNPFTSCYSTLYYFCLPLWSLPFYLPDTPPLFQLSNSVFHSTFKGFLISPLCAACFLPSLSPLLVDPSEQWLS